MDPAWGSMRNSCAGDATVFGVVSIPETLFGVTRRVYEPVAFHDTCVHSDHAWRALGRTERENRGGNRSALDSCLSFTNLGCSSPTPVWGESPAAGLGKSSSGGGCSSCPVVLLRLLGRLGGQDLVLLGSLTAAALLAGAVAAGLGGGDEGLGAQLLGLGVVDVLHQDALVLELVTLGLEVQGVVQVAVDLLVVAVPAQQAAQDAHAADPDNLGGEAGLAGTAALADAGVAAQALGLVAGVDAGAAVDDLGLLDDEGVLDQLANVLACETERSRTRGRNREREKRP